MDRYHSFLEKRSWIEIDVDQIIHNYDVFLSNMKEKTDVIPILKADAYGHGDVRVAKALEAHGVSYFAVSNIDEAMTLRLAGIGGEILILGYTDSSLASVLLNNNLTQTLVSEEYAEALAAQGVRVKCQFAIDTGMNRVGLDGEDCARCEQIIRRYAQTFELTGIFSHLCVADSDEEDNVAFTERQLQAFCKVARAVEDLRLPYVHCCNSAGGLFYLDRSNAFDTACRIVRLGIVLYGLMPDSHSLPPKGIAPALSWRSVVSMVKDLHVGETVGYGRTYCADHEMRIATISTGYADGYRRGLSNRGYVLIHGKRAPIIGRVCMDQFMVDVTDIPDAKMGDVATLIGRDGDASITADELAVMLGDAIGYEIICGISKRVHRYYKS